MKLVHLLLLCLFSTLTMVHGQQAINGKIIDENGKGLDLVLVAILQISDSSLVKSEYTDEDGSFTFTNVIEGDYYFQGNLLGYTPIKQQLSISKIDTDLEPIRMTQNAQALSEVTIKAKTPFIERKIDRTIVTPDALLSTAGSSILEMLDQAPGIVVDNDGSISLKGRSGVAVFINDKPSYLSGSELENYLRSLPTGSVKSIEIMVNPPAKYDASGGAGVINIITKRNPLMGFYGNITGSYRRSRYNGSNNSLNLNLNLNKISLYSNVYAGFYRSFQDLFINRFYKDENDIRTSSFAQNSFNYREGQYINGKVGMDYYATDKTTIGFSYKQSSNPGLRDVDNTSLVNNASDELQQRVVADNVDDTSFKNRLYNTYIRYMLDSLGSRISFDADYVQYDTRNIQRFNNFVFDPNNVQTFNDRLDGNHPAEIRIIAAKSDYVKPFEGGASLELGIKSALTETENIADYVRTIGDVSSQDNNLSNQFLYDEWINAAYANYSTKVGKVSIQGGLRLESTRLNGNQLGNEVRQDSSFSRNYNSLFPTFYISGPIDKAENHTLNFNYGRRINRPYFQDLNPFISPLDRFTFYSGNPNLLPTYSHNLSLSHSFKGRFTTSLNYSKTVDGINETLEIRDGIYYSRPGNIAENQTITLSLEASQEINSWYNFNTYIELGHLRFDSPLYTQELASRGNYIYTSLNNNFNLGKGWDFFLGGRYQSDILSAQLLIKSYWVANTAIKKRFSEGKGSIKIAVNDIFYSRRGDGIINNLEQTDADWNSKYDSRNVTCTVSYRFGKSNFKKSKYNSSGSDSEQQRVKG